MLSLKEFRKTRDAKEVPERTFGGTSRFAKVVEVYDGDTVTIQTRLSRGEKIYLYKLRLDGLDTPEKRHANPLHRKAGEAVRNVMAQKLLGKMIRIEFCREGKFGRLCGTVYVGKMTWWRWQDHYNLNAWLIREGLAKVFNPKTAKTPFLDEELQSVIDKSTALLES